MIGSPMPAIPVRWSSDETVESMDDYRGRVLVLDFFSPYYFEAFDSFTPMRELRARYDEEQVAFVGVLPFEHVRTATRQPDGQPETEGEAVARFMEDQDIAWDLVVASFDTFEEYALPTFPHFVFIDRDGVIRFQGRHTDAKTMTVLIDDLLARPSSGD